MKWSPGTRACLRVEADSYTVTPASSMLRRAPQTVWSQQYGLWDRNPRWDKVKWGLRKPRENEEKTERDKKEKR